MNDKGRKTEPKNEIILLIKYFLSLKRIMGYSLGNEEQCCRKYYLNNVNSVAIMILEDYNWTAACGLEYTVRPVCTLVHKQSQVIKQYWNAFINCFTVVKSCFRAASQSQQFLIIKSMSIKKRKCPLNNRSHIK